MKRDPEKSPRSLETLVLLIPFLGIGVVASYCFQGSFLPGAVLGLVSYFLFILFVMIGDLVLINRELAAFRNGEESD